MIRKTPRLMIALVLGLGLLAASNHSSQAALSGAERQDAPAAMQTAPQETAAVAEATPAAAVATTPAQQAPASSKPVAAPQKQAASHVTEARPVKRRAYANHMSTGFLTRRCH